MKFDPGPSVAFLLLLALYALTFFGLLTLVAYN